MLFLVAITSLPAVYRPNDEAQTMTAGRPHARANIPGVLSQMDLWYIQDIPQAYLRCISSILDISQAYPRNISGMYHAFLR